MDNMLLDYELDTPKVPNRDYHDYNEKEPKRKSHTLRIVIISLAAVIVCNFFLTGWLYKQRTDLIESRNMLLGSLDIARGEVKTASEQLTTQNRNLSVANKKLSGEIKILKTNNSKFEKNNQKLVAENKAIKNQNVELTGKNEILAEQLDKAARVFRQRINSLNAD